MATSASLHGSTVARAEQGRALALPTAYLEVSPTRAARWLALATAAVVGSCVLVTSLSITLGSPSMYGLAPIFDLGREASVPAGYSALLLLAAALLLALAASVERSREGRLWSYWAVLALGFAYLAADELVAVHEKLNRPLQNLLGASRDATTWVVAGALGALAAGVFFLPFLRALPARQAARFVAAGAVYVGSAVGLETVATQLGYEAAGGGGYGWATLGLVALEEGGEMAGVALFVWALLDHLRAAGARLELRF
jgi:hypothetical protein